MRVTVGRFAPGPHDAITDVPGVRVGHTTVRRPPDVHTGVTAIRPERVSPHTPLPAGVFTGNGYGKLIGSTQIAELGVIETPLVLTATLSAFRAADALVTWVLGRPGCAEVQSVNPVVGECNDGYLSDIRARPVTEAHVLAALDGARPGPVAQGCVGAGTGLGALGFKAGVGTASRTLAVADRPVVLGALVQANFGGTLRLGGRAVPPESLGVPRGPAPATGSCVVVVATDAPLDGRQLTRVARRAVFALGRVGAAYGHGSGDYAVAFSALPQGEGGPPVPDAALDPLFEAALDAVEQAVLHALFAAETVVGRRGRTLHALPVDRLPDLG